MRNSLLWRTYWFYWTLFKNRQTQIKRMKLKIEQHELVFRIQSNIYDGAFSRKLTAKSFIVDIRRGSKYPSYGRNVLFSFSIKATLKVTTSGIRVCSTELLLWKNQKGSTCYSMTFYKQDSTTDIFLWISIFFSDKLFHKTAPNFWL